MNPSTRALSNNRRTIESYEGFAATYATLGGPLPSPSVEAALRRMLDLTGPNAKILEIGSGPGIEADFVESLGAAVRRTDATRAFLELQAARGKQGELLNVLTDDLGGPYDALLALCVLIHIDRGEIDGVLRKIAQAIRPNGGFLVSLREGDGETIGNYHTVYWRREDFSARLAACGFAEEWFQHSVDSDGDAWLTFLSRRAR
jgi:2-polyprenyl-3-methyl-5-hydroxy-6-metoxy-1,4-benzoquinol methylase